MAGDKPQSFTGRRREKKTSFSVRFADVVSQRLITIGGIGTIVAVSLVAVLLVAVVWPLFTSATLGVAERAALPWSADTARGPATAQADSSPGGQQPLHVAVDEYRTMGWSLFADGTLQVFRLDSGQQLSRRPLFEGPAELTAISVIPDTDDANKREDESLVSVAAGFDDGSLRLGKIGFRTSFREIATVPDGLRTLGIGEVGVMEDGVVKVTPQRQFRLQQVISDFKPPLKFNDAGVQLLAHARRGKGYALAAFTADSQLFFGAARQRMNLDGDVVFKLGTKKQLDFPAHGDQAPSFVLVPTRGDAVYLAWVDGHLARFDAGKIKEAQLAEQVELLDEDNARLTVLQFALNRETLITGDSQGRVRGWFPVNRENTVQLDGMPASSDGLLLAPVHTLPPRRAAVTSLGISERSRMIVVGYDDGHVRVYEVTTNQVVINGDTEQDEAVTFAIIAPKDDGLIAATPAGLWRAEFDPGHPEATFASLFLPVWYEGYDKPDMMWQSSFAGVGPEMKLGLWPLVFGTLKATLYSMMFGAPLALLAAIFTSEFLDPRAKAAIKPLVEMMASLPSVVLGFLAALVFAPVVEQFVPMSLAVFATLPATVLLSAFLWHLLPNHVALSFGHLRFPIITFVVVPIGFWLAWLIGPTVESWFFAGDVKLWLDGQIGTGTGAWMLLVLPLTAIGITALVAAAVNPSLRRASGSWDRRKFSLVNLLKFLVALVLTFLAAWGISSLLTTVGLDPRGSYVDTYVQRNALVVGFVMGFAVIPIIYTIAEDALSTVPQHLRSASLGAGATQWQTAIRIVVPTAMSGLFSALMIGLGRAVGETMIVLMAGGNTPVREWNIFNGFRTLAANIAVELPEAVQNSTHYRTLFLAALTLFIMTFFVNTIAELVRLRFRKRAVEL